MKNKFFLFCLPVLFFSLNLPARTLIGIKDSSATAFPSPEILLQEIMAVTGSAMNFVLKAANVKNIEAAIRRGKHVIYYNPDYISQVNNFSGDKWAVLFLLAHETGHHLKGHTSKRSGSKPPLELEADEFAGSVLFRVGASLRESVRIIHYIASHRASASHPGRSDRLKAIEKGWTAASVRKK